MDIEKRLQMSYYKTIASINDAHKIYVVQNTQNGHIYIKKELDVYNYDVYQYLLSHHIKGTPYIYDIYIEDDTLTIIEEYISGYTLEELLNQKHSFNDTELKSITIQLCDILNNLHSCSPAIIHRDLKPSNIIMKEDGQIILLDLNAAKHYSNSKNEDTTLLGTKGYAAPEQYGFGTSNARTDIYALGMVINTLLYGEPNPVAFPDSIFTPIIKKCIQLNPKDRYKSVIEIKRQLWTPDASLNQSNKYWMKYLPPGFRHMRPLNIIVSSIVYIFTLWLCCTLQVKNATPKALFIERLFCFIIFYGVYFISADYIGIQKTFPLCRSNNIFIKIVGIILFDLAYMFSLFVLMVILSSIAA